MIKRLKVTVTRTDEYLVEIDTDVINEEWQKEFEKSFHPLEGLDDIARDLANHQIRSGSDLRFIEGYGNVTRDGKIPFSFNDYDINGNRLPPDQLDQPAPGLNIDILSEDEQYDFEVEAMDI